MSVTTADLWRMSALELAEAIRSRLTSSQEVIEAHLRRIEAVNPSVNAVTVVLGEQALGVVQQVAQQCGRLTRRRGRGALVHGSAHCGFGARAPAWRAPPPFDSA